MSQSENQIQFLKKRISDIDSFEPGLNPELLKHAINLSHPLFVYGITTGQLKLEVKSKKAEFLKHFVTPQVRILIIFLLILTVAPIIAIPIFCYLKSKWILLLGLLSLWFATIITNLTLGTSKPKNNFIEFTLIWVLFTGILIYYLGIFNTFSFLAICFTYEYFFLCFSDIIHDEIAKQQLIKDENFYNEAIEKSFINLKYI